MIRTTTSQFSVPLQKFFFNRMSESKHPSMRTTSSTVGGNPLAAEQKDREEASKGQTRNKNQKYYGDVNITK